MNKKLNNPFVTKTIDIPDAYFCDRKDETAALIKKIENGSNIVLKAPRRIGKSSLIRHLFCQKQISSRYNTLYVDIYGTRNMDGFIDEFQSAFLDAPFAKTEAGKRKVAEFFRSLLVNANMDQSGNLIGFSLGVNQPRNVSITLKEMFAFLEKTSKPNIVAFDEFQQINGYPENAAAIIRTFVQKMNNTFFIFSGSSRHLLDRMFEYPNEPFYRSAASMTLCPIGPDSYTEFCQEMFGLYDKAIEKDAIEFVYNLLSANTYDMQEVMKETFPEIAVGETATMADIKASINRLLDSRDEEFRGILNKVENDKNRRVLFCILREGLTNGLTSGQMLKKYNLDNASSVQNALHVLQGDHLNVITRIAGSYYQARDRFLELWWARKEGTLEMKFSSAVKRYEKELALRSEHQR